MEIVMSHLVGELLMAMLSGKLDLEALLPISWPRDTKRHNFTRLRGEMLTLI